MDRFPQFILINNTIVYTFLRIRRVLYALLSLGLRKPIDNDINENHRTAYGVFKFSKKFCFYSKFTCIPF